MTATYVLVREDDGEEFRIGDRVEFLVELVSDVGDSGKAWAIGVVRNLFKNSRELGIDVLYPHCIQSWMCIRDSKLSHTTNLTPEEKLAAVAEFLNDLDDNAIYFCGTWIQKLFENLHLSDSDFHEFRLGTVFNSDLTLKS